MPQTTMTEMTQALKTTNEKSAVLNQTVKVLLGTQYRYSDTELNHKIAELLAQDDQLLKELFAAWDVSLARADKLGPSLHELQDLMANYQVFEATFHKNLDWLGRLKRDRQLATASEIKKMTNQRIATVSEYVDKLKRCMMPN